MLNIFHQNPPHEAALDLNDYQILQLIGQIPPENQLLIEAMTSLVDNFQLEAIAILTQI
jgi:two-component system, chemotaxis family, sensor kinase Cph1